MGVSRKAGVGSQGERQSKVVEQFAALKDAGCDGLQINFFDFAPDLAYFADNVLPLMKQAGLRN